MAARPARSCRGADQDAEGVRGSRRPQADRLAGAERADGVLEAVRAERRPDPETDRSVTDPGREGDPADDVEGDGPASPSGGAGR